jgi:hypothetical protein
MNKRKLHTPTACTIIPIVVLILMLTTLFTPTAFAYVFLFGDDFNDNSLDENKWILII